jgi:hypothetical protein
MSVVPCLLGSQDLDKAARKDIKLVCPPNVIVERCRKGYCAGGGAGNTRHSPDRRDYAGLPAEAVSNLGRDLAIRRLVNCFNTCDASSRVVSLKKCFQLALCLTRAKNQNGLCIPDTRNDRIVVNVRQSGECPLAAIILRHQLWFKGTLERRIARTTELSFALGDDQPCLLPFV